MLSISLKMLNFNNSFLILLLELTLTPLVRSNCRKSGAKAEIRSHMKKNPAPDLAKTPASAMLPVTKN